MNISGIKIRALRKSKQLTIKELADRVGLSSSAIGMYERGMRTPDLETIFILSRFFSVDLEYFFDGIERSNSNNKILNDDKIESAYLRKQILERSKGFCELCGNMAPFISQDGQPYLELYILESDDSTPLSKKNIAAVCPNCLKKLQVLKLPGDIIYLQNRLKNFYNRGSI
ncbi:transcriptional regulator [Paenibacillus polymyxa]|nr:transcriptional regulator [Paenibacillus polymyxa]